MESRQQSGCDCEKYQLHVLAGGVGGGGMEEKVGVTAPSGCKGLDLKDRRISKFLASRPGRGTSDATPLSWASVFSSG
jgi:hypothetical protein